MNNGLLSIESLTVIAVCFATYFLGIVLRYFALPGKNPMPLRQQCAIGFVLAFAIVGPFLVVMRAAFFGAETNAATAFATIGVILEHGFVMNNTLTREIRRMVSRDVPNVPQGDL